MIASTPWKYDSYGAPWYWWTAIHPFARPAPVDNGMSSAADTRTSIGNSGGNESVPVRSRTRLTASGIASTGMPYSISTKRTRRGLQKM